MKQQTYRGTGLLVLLLLIAALFLIRLPGQNEQGELSSQQFEQVLDGGGVQMLVIHQNEQVPTGRVQMQTSDGRQYETYVSDVKKTEEMLQEKGIDFTIQNVSQSSYWMSVIFPVVLSVGGVALIIFMMNMRAGAGGGGTNAKMMNFGKSRARMTHNSNVTFKNVAGLQEEKEDLEEMVDFLRNPQKYTGVGARIPKGVILVGPPGTGKTLLAKAVAGEAGVPFFSISGSDFVEMFVGVGASRVRDLFEDAKKNAPCIVFIDEIDAVARRRGTGMGGGHDEREQTLNQLLVEMDGFGVNEGIIVMAATNRVDILDPAILRPGRFDRRVIVDKPDLKGRTEILQVHAKNVSLDETVDLPAIALATSGAVGSDLANMINEAAILAVKNGRNAVCQKDLFEAVEVVLVGKEKKDRVLSREERRIVSYHEVGHALVSALQKDAEPVQKITIVPRTMGALGYVMHVPEEEKYLNSKKEIQAMLVGYLGGRAAEEIVFDSVTTGASNDIEQATKLARAMVTQYGMSEKFGLMGLASQENRYLDGRVVMNCGDATVAEVDKEVMRILDEAYEEAKRLLRENRDVMDQIAEFLIEKETITGKEFMQIFRRCKGIPEPENQLTPAEKLEQETEKEIAKQNAETELAGQNQNEEMQEFPSAQDVNGDAQDAQMQDVPKSEEEETKHQINLEEN